MSNPNPPAREAAGSSASTTWRRIAGRSTLAVWCWILCPSPAMAQSLKQAGTNIFNALYGIVGVVGAIALLATSLNWATGNWLGRDDPKRLFFQVLFAVALAFAVVTIIQFVKDSVGASASGIGSL